MVDSCMGDKRNTQDIICGGLRKILRFIHGRQKNYTRYKLLTVVWETKEIHKI